MIPFLHPESKAFISQFKFSKETLHQIIQKYILCISEFWITFTSTITTTKAN